MRNKIPFVGTYYATAIVWFNNGKKQTFHRDSAHYCTLIDRLAECVNVKEMHIIRNLPGDTKVYNELSNGYYRVDKYRKYFPLKKSSS